MLTGSNQCQIRFTLFIKLIWTIAYVMEETYTCMSCKASMIIKKTSFFTCTINVTLLVYHFIQLLIKLCKQCLVTYVIFNILYVL